MGLGMLNLDGLDLSEEVLAELKKRSEGYESPDDVAGLKSALAKVREEKTAATDAAREAERIAGEERLKIAQAKGDVESVQTEMQAKIDLLQSSIDDSAKQSLARTKDEIARNFVNSNVVDDVLSRDAMSAEYAKRIDVRDGKVVVLDPNGNLTTMAVADLDNEFTQSSRYAAHIVGTKGTGGGAGGSGDNGGGATKNFADYTSQELVKIKAANPAEYERLRGTAPHLQRQF